MNVLIRAEAVHLGGLTPAIRMRCPFCRVMGTLESFGTGDLQLPGHYVGSRRCPNPDCRALIFTVTDGGGALIASYPAETLDFDASDLPVPVARALREAVHCHAVRCYTAAAMMVRKTLEELCADRGAKGKTLKDRIRALREKVVLPEELFDGMDELRLLGNDAAHVESRVFNEVGKEEVEIGIEFAKEILKAVYQHASLLARLQALKAQHEDEAT
jgi:hypothetical protein